MILSLFHDPIVVVFACLDLVALPVALWLLAGQRGDRRPACWCGTAQRGRRLVDAGDPLTVELPAAGAVPAAPPPAVHRGQHRVGSVARQA